MTPAQLARDAVRIAVRLEGEQLRRIMAYLDVVERDALTAVKLLDLSDTTTARVIKQLRAQQVIQQSQAARALLSMGDSSGPLAAAFREGISEAYQEGLANATRHAVSTGAIDAATAAAVNQFGARVELELINAILNTTLTTLKGVGETGLRSIEDAIVRVAIRGSGPQVAAREVRKSVDLTRYEAERITRTVYMSANNTARDQMFEQLDVEYLQVNATNDERTCPFCGARHGMVYRRREAPVPPYHPFCRCVLTPWSASTPASRRGDEFFVLTRAEIDKGIEPNQRVSATAQAPFERMNGVTPSPPVWTPERGWVNAQ